MDPMSDPELKPYTVPAARPWWKHWQPYVVALCLGVIGFSAGRFMGPTFVESTQAEHASVEAREQVETKKAAEVVTITRWRPALHPTTGVPLAGCDGGVAMEGETVTASKSLTELTRATDFTGTTSSTVTTKTTARPDWRVGVLVGGQFAGKPALEFAGPLVLGGQVERRIVGEVWVGAWGLTSGAAGGSVAVGF